ncbi:MAG: ArsR family transcriptional regulator [Candidatus Lokiarchaeota archaeon]|nr:ArsR family transcriptional regulator [Candidatus Harpocratesius repetitus]
MEPSKLSSPNFPSDLINDIFHPKRLELLHFLSFNDETFTSITHYLGISSSETSRHLNSSVKLNLVRKDVEHKKYRLTPFGNLIIHLFQPTLFILNHAPFFQTHTLAGFPTRMIPNLIHLSKAEFIKGTGNVMLRFSQVFDIVQEEVKLMTDQAFPFGKANLRAKYIVPKEMLKYKDNTKKNLTSEIRLLDPIHFSLVITDIAGSFIFFPNDKGQPDFTEGFYILNEDHEGMKFLNQLWDIFWAKGTEFSLNY